MAYEEQEINIGDIYEKIKKRAPSKALGLIRNPFPPTGVAGMSTGEVPFLLRARCRSTLNMFVKAALEGNDFCGLVIVGEYGSGKTSILRYFAHAVNNAQGFGIPVGSIYVSSPGSSFSDILQSMIRAIGKEILVKYGWALFIKWLKGSPGDQRFIEVGLPYPDKEHLITINDAGSFWEVFDNKLLASRKIITNAVNMVMVRELPDPYFARNLAEMMLGDRSTASETWSEFSKPVSSYGTKKPVVSDRMASILKICRVNGIDHLFVLVDEFEDVAFNRMSKKMRDDFTATLRAIIGDQGSNLSIVIASNLPGWRLLVRSDASLEDRFKFKIELDQLDDEEVFELINKYITHAKDPDSESTAKMVFSRELTSFVANTRHRIPRPILITFHALVENYWDDLTPPTLEDIENYLSQVNA